MKRNASKKFVLVLLACIFTIGLVSAVLKAASYIGEKNAYVEVGSNGAAYVPKTAKYVKYNGEIRRIVKFASILSEEEINCKCPKCCDGYCYAIVFSNSGPMSNPIIILSVIWFACG
jgi:hypothetical protein